MKRALVLLAPAAVVVVAMVSNCGGSTFTTSGAGKDASAHSGSSSAVCGGAGELCCVGSTCSAGLTCSEGVCGSSGGSGTSPPIKCGNVGQPCCSGSCLYGMCDGEGVCSATSSASMISTSSSAACGSLGEPCCDASICYFDLTCQETYGVGLLCGSYSSMTSAHSSEPSSSSSSVRSSEPSSSLSSEHSTSVSTSPSGSSSKSESSSMRGSSSGCTPVCASVPDGGVEIPCGDDGCGGSCGYCKNIRQVCGDAGVCVNGE